MRCLPIGQLRVRGGSIFKHILRCKLLDGLVGSRTSQIVRVLGVSGGAGSGTCTTRLLLRCCWLSLRSRSHGEEPQVLSRSRAYRTRKAMPGVSDSPPAVPLRRGIRAGMGARGGTSTSRRAVRRPPSPSPVPPEPRGRKIAPRDRLGPLHINTSGLYH